MPEAPLKTKKPSQPLTEYVVLRRLTVRPANAASKGDGWVTTERDAWVPVLNEKSQHGPDGQVRVIKAVGPDAAIKAYRTDVPKGEDPHWGTFRAVAVSSWKGAATFKPIQSELREIDEGL